MIGACLAESVLTMLRTLPDSEYCETVNVVTWIHRGRGYVDTLVETSDPRGYLHELSLFRETIAEADVRCTELPVRNPADGHLLFKFEVAGWGTEIWRLTIIRQCAPDGHADRLDYYPIDGVVRHLYQASKDDPFLPYRTSDSQVHMVHRMSQPLRDVRRTFYAPYRRPVHKSAV